MYNIFTLNCVHAPGLVHELSVHASQMSSGVKVVCIYIPTRHDVANVGNVLAVGSGEWEVVGGGWFTI